MALQLGADPKQCAVDGSAIIFGELNNACLDDKATEFDQMPGALAPLDLPGAHVIASLCRLPAVAGCPVALERRECCAEIPEQLA